MLCLRASEESSENPVHLADNIGIVHHDVTVDAAKTVSTSYIKWKDFSFHPFPTLWSLWRTGTERIYNYPPYALKTHQMALGFGCLSCRQQQHDSTYT